MISDGVRPRTLWKPGDGDGDPSSHTVHRSINTLRGHPTWKLFAGDIPLPVQRGSLAEPPHYIYLDDKACYTIFCSKAYNKVELRKYWPWDFDHLGNIKQDRKNRGRPAYLDDSHKEFATGPRRTPAGPHTFSGEPRVRPTVKPKTDAPKKPREAIPNLVPRKCALNLGVPILRPKKKSPSNEQAYLLHEWSGLRGL
ncbi:uncharacterized protein BDR25DRAFT_354347 [Lindgomyces ingoldianus]|uniref:Uncharacterized protein n=1 Tax=Lindgomyces ingoldianus TaxID=673940 RepID=A0ACB6QXX5_9PLEO|nr:uncharacterized protein BDR25DRAFT_354347 [Lindgomyces ingoldianus]KAF2471839.1 hypothetical protein BDR25DRAFT_354347 [Lindgomyces ingoldianus]